MPVGTPFPDITQHVIKTIAIRLFRPDRMSLASRISGMPSDLAEITGGRSRVSASSAFFPFRFRRQSKFEPGLNLNRSKKLLDIIIRDIGLRKIPSFRRRGAVIHDRIPNLPSDLEFADPNSFDKNTMNRPFSRLASLFLLEGSHQKFPFGNMDHIDPKHQRRFPEALLIFPNLFREGKDHGCIRRNFPENLIGDGFILFFRKESRDCRRMGIT